MRSDQALLLRVEAAARVTPVVTWAKDAYWVGYVAFLGVILRLR